MLNIIKALADDNRWKLCQLLITDGEKAVHECATAINLSQSATSQHLAKLRNVGLITARRDKTTIYYGFVMTDPAGILHWFVGDDQ